MDFNEKQKSLVQMLTSENSRINPMWLKPDELLHQLELITENLPKNTKLIGENTHEQMTAIYNLAKSTTFATEHTLVSIIEIPLIESREFEHAKIYTLPVKHDEKMIKPVIFKEHVWWNDGYVNLLSNSELEKCIDYGNKYYCELNSLLFIKSNMKLCEWQLIQNKTATECEHTESKSNETYIKFQNNHWLFSVRDAVNATIKCEDYEKEATIKGNGILELNDGCEMNTRQNKIKAVKVITTNVRATTMQMQIHKVKWPAKTLNLMQFREKLQTKVKTLENNDDRLFWHQIHHYVTIYSIIMTLLFIICYFYTKLEVAPLAGI